MNITETLAQNLLAVFVGNNWSEAAFATTLEGINHQQATTITPASPNTIAALVNHICYWNNMLRERINGADPEISETNGFDVTDVTSEADWLALIAKTRQSFMNLAGAMAGFPPDRLLEKTNHGASTFEVNFYGTIEHAYYHLGQMVMLKHLVMA